MPYDKQKPASYPEPKLFPESKYGGKCDMCGEEYPKGVPVWAWNGMYFCGIHPKAEIMENMREEAEPSPAPAPAPISQSVSNVAPESSMSLSTVIERMSYEVRSVLRDGHMIDGKTNTLLGHIDETLAHIDHVLKENNEEARKTNMLLTILVEQGKK
jgi:hypothetical protein